MAVGSVIVAIVTKGLGPDDIASVQKRLDPEPAAPEPPAAPAPADPPLVAPGDLFSD